MEPGHVYSANLVMTLDYALFEIARTVSSDGVFLSPKRPLGKVNSPKS